MDSSLPISGFTESILCHLYFIGSLELQIQDENCLDGTFRFLTDFVLHKSQLFTRFFDNPNIIYHFLPLVARSAISSVTFTVVCCWGYTGINITKKFFFFNFFIGVQLIHSTVLVSVTQQSEPAIHTYIPTLAKESS